MNWTAAFDQVPQLDPDYVYEKHLAGDIIIVDVRESSEWTLGHIDGSKLIPLGEVAERAHEIEHGKPVLCVCRVGSRSLYASVLLRQAGIEAANLEGGLINWKASGLPLTEPGLVAAH